MVTLSSTESETAALCEGSTFAVWWRDMLVKMGVTVVGPIPLLQDNTSTIWLTSHEGNFQRNKHIIIRRNFVKEHISNGDVTIVYERSSLLTADIGTKPVPSSTLERAKKNIGIVELESEEEKENETSK
jgi:hypothetical protein